LATPSAQNHMPTNGDNPRNDSERRFGAPAAG
jgi:hypothetical protein